MVRGSLWTISREPILPGVQNWGSRLGLIISSDAGNCTGASVLIAWCSTKIDKRRFSVNISIEGDGIFPSVVLCNQIVTVTKEWLREYRGQLSDAQQREVDRGLCQTLGLIKAQIYQDALTQREAAEERYHEALRLIARQELLLEALRFQLREGTPSVSGFAADCSLREGALPPSPEASPIDINSATEKELRALGLTELNIIGILSGRPFSSLKNLQNYLKLTDAAMSSLTPKIVVAPPPGSERPKNIWFVQEPQMGEPEEPPEEFLPLRVHETKPAALKEFLLDRGFRESHAIGLRSAILRYREEHGALPHSIDQLSANSRLTPKTLYRLSQLEKEGVISFD